MKNLTSLNFILIAVFLCTACKKEKDKVEALQKEVIAVHDEVMPKMDEVMKLKSSLKAIKNDTTVTLPSDKLLLVNNLIDNLEKADNSMMNWMRNYDSLMEGMSEEEKLTYLQKQENSIQQVKQSMLSSISEASQFLEKR